MEILTIDKLIYLLEKDHCYLDVVSENNKKCSIAPKMFINFDSAGGNMEYSGYTLEFENKEFDFDDFCSLTEFLKDKKIINDGKISLKLINDKFSKLSLYEEDKEFNNLDMKGLLEKYSTASEFEVVVPYGHGYTASSPYGTVKLSKKDAEIAIDGLQKQTIKSLKATYDNLSKKDKSLIPEFEVFINDVIVEIETLLDGRRIDLFMCDKVSKGQTKYSEPIKFVWRAYLELEELSKRKIEVVKMQDIPESRSLTCELDGVFSDIKECFISATPTYSWHSTTTSMLYKLYRFKLNEKSKNWLMQFEDDYKIEGFEDLAFYRDDKILFSSCTHEGFHVDLSK